MSREKVHATIKWHTVCAKYTSMDLLQARTGNISGIVPVWQSFGDKRQPTCRKIVLEDNFFLVNYLLYCFYNRCLALSDTEYKSDAIIIAGDISDDSQVIKDTLKLFLSKWEHVFFVPGNHELWMRRSDAHLKDSLRKPSTHKIPTIPILL